MIDEFTRECLMLKADRGITSADVIDSLAELFATRGVPKHIRSDNGPEFIANELRAWLDRVGVSTLCIEPSSPWENGFAEGFHSRFRDECLALEVFDGLRDARAITAAWKNDYNHRRPRGSHGCQTRPGSPLRVRHPPRPRPRLLPHTRLFAWARPNPEPSCRLVQEIKAGQTQL
jgi:transposase InsO family protein